MAAAASSLNSQAQQLVQAVAVFQLSNQHAAPAGAPQARRKSPPVTLSKPAPTSRPKGVPAPRAAAPAPQIASAAKDGDGNWESF